MLYIIVAEHIEDGYEVVYSRKKQVTIELNGEKYKYFIPYDDSKPRYYSTAAYGMQGILFLREQLKQPVLNKDGSVQWVDVWQLNVVKIQESNPGG